MMLVQLFQLKGSQNTNFKFLMDVLKTCLLKKKLVNSRTKIFKRKAKEEGMFKEEIIYDITQKTLKNLRQFKNN